jgi:hypothetical protein
MGEFTPPIVISLLISILHPAAIARLMIVRCKGMKKMVKYIEKMTKSGV